jgi:YVTN family beta-propeller protein
MIHRLFLTGLLASSPAFAVLEDHAQSDAFAAEAARLAPAFTPTAQQLLPPPPEQMQGLGSWSAVIPWTPHIPVTCAQLPDGRLLTFASNQRTTFPVGPEFTYAATWDYRTGQFVEFNNTRHDMFCGGVVMLPDGRVLVNGGRNTTRLSSIFDWRTNTWSAIPNMQDPRWYNTSVALPNGTVFTASGSGGPATAERWNEGIGWTRLTGINWQLAYGEGGFESDWHPFVTVAPDGRIAHTGPTDSMHWVVPTGSGQFIDTNVDVPGSFYPKDGAFVMYDIGKVLLATGRSLNSGATNEAYTVDINGPAPVITRTGNVIQPRTFSNSVVLPNGEVMMIGGNTSQIKFSDQGSVLMPEIWNPQTGQWRAAANASVPRNYHSLAVLLPDGRVWSGGGGLSGNSADHRDAQIYTPGALFNADGSAATRPVITDAPEEIGAGMAFSVKATSGMRNFTFIKLASLTHSVGTDLRFMNLPFTEDSAGNYTLHSHTNLNVMTPGYWMLFAISPAGPYSESRIIHVTADNAPSIANPGDQTTPLNQNVSLQITATGQGTITFAATGLPPGLSINSTGLISGTVAELGVSLVTITATSSLGPTASHQFRWTVIPTTLGSGSILREWWTGISGVLVSNLTASTAYPNNPTGRDQRTSLEAPTDWADNYGQRLRGWIHPPITGQYRFWVAGDDETQLKLGTNDSPATAVTIARVPSWTNSREWSRYPEQTSALITLQAGQRYYIEVIMKEGTGGDNLAAAWEIPGTGSGPIVIPGQYLSPWVIDSPPVITNPGTQSSVVENAVVLQINAADAENAPLAFSATGLPAGLSISSTGRISGTPTTAGSSNVIVSVSDGVNTPVTASFVWNVAAQLVLNPLSGAPAPVNTAITFTASASGGLNPQFKWSFGDGTPDSAFSSTTTVSKTYSAPGRYIVTLTARDSTGREVSTSFRQAVHAALTTAQPRVSSSIAYQVRTNANARLWVVNPDQNSVTVFDAVTRARSGIINVGNAPRSVAIASDGRAWVVNSESASISIIGTNLSLAQTVTLPRGSRPYGIVFDPTGNTAYVSLQDTGRVIKINRSSPTSIAGTAVVGSDVRHLSVSADGAKVYATRFITPRLPGEETASVITQNGAAKYGGIVAVITASSMAVARTIVLEHSNEIDSSTASRGIPNYLGPAVLSPDGRTAWVPSKQDNIKRGMLRDGLPLTHDSAVRSITSRLDLTTDTEDFAARIDYNDAGIASTACYEPKGMYLFTALEGSREVAVVDSWGKREILRFTAGRAPQGVVTSPDGRTLFVHNFMDRTVTIHDVGSIINGAETAPALTATLACITTEKLAANVLNGKRLFYDARDSRLALQQYISCASCHNDGGQDGRVWDFTGFGEGLRNNISLKGHATHGPAHWTGNFDEIQDFEGQIRGFAGGLGLISNGTPHPPLGTPNAGRSADLDALAAYVNSLTTTGNSPNRNTNGTLTTDATAGQTLFKQLNCAACHSGTRFTNSALNVFRDIGTIKPTSGKRLDGPLTGLDVPTLRGLWNTAPYLHDGSAATLADAVSAHQGVTLTTTQLNQISAYLSQIEDSTVSAPAPINIVLATASSTVSASFAVTGTLSEAATGFTVGDISITGGTISGFTLNGTAFSFNVAPAASSIQISIPAGVMTDSVGVANLASNVLTITNGSDVTKPAITLATASNAVSGAFTVTLTPSEPVTGLALGDFAVTNGTASALTSSSVTITPTAAGVVTVQLPAGTVADAAGNTNTASNVLTVTYTPPVAVTSVMLQAEDFDEGAQGVTYNDTEAENFGLTWGGFSYRNSGVDIENSGDTDATPSVGWTAAGEWLQFTKSLSPGTYELSARAATPLAGPAQIRVVVNGTAAGTFNITPTGGWLSWRTFTIPNVSITASGSSTIRLEFVNGGVNLNWVELKNTSAPDTTKPSVQLATASGSVSAPFTVSATFSEAVSGVALNDFVITNGTASGLSGSGASYSVLVTPAADGPVTVAMPENAASDAAGNTSTASNTLNVNFTAPVDPLPTVVLSTAASSVTESFTVNAQFSESVSGLLGSEFVVTNGSVTGLSGSGALWIATIQPTATGAVGISLPANAALDSAGQGNTTSNTLTVNYAPVTRQNGITADYFAGLNFDQLRFSRIDPNVDFVWTAAPDSRLPGDNFSVRWHGCVIPRATGLHTFNTRSDDGVRLWVNNVLLIDNWTNHGEEWDYGSINLQAGVPVVIKMEFYEAGGEAVAKLWWEGPTHPYEVIPTSALLINENGMNAAPYPATFAEWTESGRSNGTGSLTTAWTNADGDDLPDLLEYALGTPAGSGVSSGDVLKIENGTASLTKPASIRDLRWFLESTTDLRTWTPLILAPSITDHPDGTETLRWALPAGPHGIIRLRVQLISTGDTAATPPQAWTTLNLTAGIQSVGVQTVNAPIYTGFTHSISGSSIFLSDASYLPALVEPGARYYIELRNGPLAGHRLDLSHIGDRALVIDTASPLNTLDELPASLESTQIAVHRHITLAQVFAKEALKGSTGPNAADQVLFLENGAFRMLWLFQSGSTRFWTTSGDAALGSADGTLIAPGTGVLFKSAFSTPRALFTTGRVRTTPFAIRVSEGNQFLTQPWPLAASPATLHMLTGFQSSTHPGTADALQLWKGDAAPNTSGYTGLWLFHNTLSGSTNWVFTSDAALRSENASLIFPPGRAFFLKPATSTRGVWIVPSPEGRE